jgi:3-deoxy-D-manno-octulosonate 8-phosphate phosphatase (KDO 8-P phosphatase)
LELAISNHFRVAVISRTSSPPLRQTLAGIGITDSYLNASIKNEAFDEFCLPYDLLPADILIMGDDMPDYEIMQLCGVRTCPADAASEIRSLCQYISPRKGGNGCVRDVIEQVLKAQGKWPNK